MADLQSIKLDFIADTTQLDKAITKTTKIEREIRKLAASVGKGAITNKQYENRVKQLASELQRLTRGNIAARNSVNAFSTAQYQAARATEVDTVATQKNTQATNQNTQAKKGNVKGQNELGVAVQQTGYQVGDFLVQVQSGTNVMVAFGQQATQLVGVLPLLSNSLGVSAGKLIAISTGLGIAIPLATALGAAFMRTREATEDSIKTLVDYRKELAGLSEDIKNQFRVESLGVSKQELSFLDAITLAYTELEDAQEALQVRKEQVLRQGESSSSFWQREAGDVKDAQTTLSELQKQYQDFLDTRSKLLNQSQSLDPFGGEGDLAFSPEGLAKSAEEARKLSETYLESFISAQDSISQNWQDEIEEMNRQMEKEHQEYLRTLERDFNNTTLSLKIRFQAESDVMSQAVSSSGRMSPDFSWKELIAMGWSPEDLERIGMSPPRATSGGSSSQS